MEVPRRRVAVVGSGVAGLSTAFLLSRKHAVSLFEREANVGMDAHSLDAHGARMDIPLRVFSESYYPNLCNLYRLVGVKYHYADYSFSCLGGAEARSYFRYINLFIGGMALPLPGLYNPLQLAKCVRLAFQLAHFFKRSPAYMEADPACATMTIGQFLKAHGYSKEFASDLLYPMLSVVCTCTCASAFERSNAARVWNAAAPPRLGHSTCLQLSVRLWFLWTDAAVEAYPAQIVVDYFANK